MYYPIVPADLASCPLCLDFFSESNQEVVAHEGEGWKHPVHLRCVSEWLAQNPTCPSCRFPIISSPAIPLKERKITLCPPFTNIDRQMYFMIFFGIMIGTPIAYLLNQEYPYAGPVVGELIGLGLAKMMIIFCRQVNTHS